MTTNNYIEIPSDYWQFYNKPGHFITYYGDVYFGILCKCPKYEDRVFIVQNDKRRELFDLKPEDQTLEKYRQYGWEIRSFDIFRTPPIANDSFGGENQYKQHTRYNVKPYKRMFVFGAGASAYCAFGDKTQVLRSSKLRPPIGYEIFDEDFQPFYEKYSGVKLTIPVYEAKGRDIEGCMEDEWQKFRYTYNPQLLNRHINVQYYLQELFNEISRDVIKNHNRKNLYSLFANKLQQHYSNNEEEKVSIVSFNYDTILDHYLSAIFDHPFNSMDDYIKYENSFLYFKPHGSSNWGWKFKPERLMELNGTGSIADRLYNNKIELWQLYYYLLGDPEQNIARNSWGYELLLHPNRLGRYTLNKNRIEIVNNKETYYPALLLPYRDKDEFLMHYDHQSSMMTAMNEVEELYLIGWKGNEAVFNRMMNTQANRLQKIIIVNPNERDKKEVSNYLKDYPRLASVKIEVVDTFEEFVLDKMDNIFSNRG